MSKPISNFVGRENELSQLNVMIKSSTPKIAVIYGRRRIGKSELIKKALENSDTLFFEGLENRPKQEQIDNFILQLRYQTQQEKPYKKKSSWTEAFLLLFETLKKKSAHIVLDEFQWMANYRSQIVSELKMAWDQYFSSLKGVNLILCGSIASFMTKKLVQSNAFYGRTDIVIHLKGFALPEIKKMLPGHGHNEILEAAMIFGGVPKYLELIKSKPSVRVAVESLAFTENGYFTDEYERIFLSHFGTNREYESIVKILAENPYGLMRTDLAEKAKISHGGGLSEHLQNLESAGFIISETPFDKGYNSRLIKYRLSDPYLLFYFAFIKASLKQIKSGFHNDIFLKLSQSASFYSWMGRAFENLCINHAGKISEILGFSGVNYTCGPYFRPPRKNSPGVQIDMVFHRDDNVITLCEMKYTTGKVGTDIIDSVEKKADILTGIFSGKTIQKVLITRSEPTKDLKNTGYFYKTIMSDELF